MGRLGSLLAFWTNMKCPWFRDHVLPGVNLWEVFVGQDAEEVQRRVRALPREGRRPRVLLPRGEKARECLDLDRDRRSGAEQSSGTGITIDLWKDYSDGLRFLALRAHSREMAGLQEQDLLPRQGPLRTKTRDLCE